MLPSLPVLTRDGNAIASTSPSLSQTLSKITYYYWNSIHTKSLGTTRDSVTSKYSIPNKSLGTNRDSDTSTYSLPIKSLDFTKYSGTSKYSIPKFESP